MVKIRLKRLGAHKKTFYRVVVQIHVMQETEDLSRKSDTMIH